MKISLITPPSAFLLDERVFPALGILKVASVLEACEFEVEHLDLAGVDNYLEVLSLFLRQTEAEVIGLTATSPQMPAVSKILGVIKLFKPQAKVILGGPHVTLVHAAAIRGSHRAYLALEELKRNFSVIVAGDGEAAIFRALEISGGLINADDPKSPYWMTNKGFELSPKPARHLIDLDSYKYYIDGVRAASLISQLGCPFDCAFCAGRDSAMLRRIRIRPPDNVLDELLDVYEEHGIRGWMFLDDELNVNKQFISLLKLLYETAQSQGIKWRLRGFLKAELFTDEQAQWMYAAGFRQILIGFESGHERILTNINKKSSRDDNSRAVDIAHRHGLKVKALMSIGHPGETEESILATRDWLLKMYPSDFDVTVITPYPGSPYYDHAELVGDGVWCFTAPKTGDKLYMDDVDFTKDALYYKGAPGDYKSFVWTDSLSPQRICALRDEVEHEVRTKLNIPYYSGRDPFEFVVEDGKIPSSILRRS